MNRRPTWHPSYGTLIPAPSPWRVSKRKGRALQRVYDPTGPIPFPKESTLTDRTVAMRDRVIVCPRRQWWRVPFTVAGFVFFGYGFALIDTAPGTASVLALFGAMSWATALARDVR